MEASTNSSIMELWCNPQTGYFYIAGLCCYVLIQPVFILVLYVGFQQRTSGSSAAVTSHSDVFTFNMIALEVLNVLISFMYCWGLFTVHLRLIFIGENGIFMTTMGQMFFHNLTCVERYLAVVHPIIYLRLKKTGGVRIRNISIGCAWLLSFVLMMTRNLTKLPLQGFLYTLIVAILSLIIITFCTISVLCVLIRPGPGETGRDRKKIKQSKRAAFDTMMFILGALLSRFFVIFLSYTLFFASTLTLKVKCLLSVATFWFSLPSSLVLPLLFLHRAGRLTKWKQTMNEVISTINPRAL